MAKKKPVVPRLQKTVVSDIPDQLKIWDAGLIKFEKIFLLVILLLAIAFRTAYFIQLNKSPLIWQHKMMESDMHFYDEWAKYIADGHWLSDTALHQYGQVNIWIGESYLKLNPEVITKLKNELGENADWESMLRLQWQQWDGGKIFHQDPLYIYMVAVTYKVCGADVRYVFGWQMLLGICSIFLIYLISKNYFGITVAFIAAALAVLCGPLMFYELVLLRESLIVFGGLLLVYISDKLFSNQNSVSNRQLILTGMVTGLCMLLKSTFSLFFLLMLILLVTNGIRKKLPWLKQSLLFLTGLLIAYTPLMIRNSIIGVPVLSQNTVGALTVISSNVKGYQPEQSYMIDLKSTTRIMAQTQGQAFKGLIASIKTHESLFGYAGLVLKKLSLVFHWYEFPNNKNFYYYQIYAPVLSLAFVNWLWIGPFAMAGLMLSVYKRKKLWPLFLLVAMHIMLLVLFLVLARYRIALVAALIPFAAYAFVYAIVNLKHRINQSVLIWVFAAAMVFVMGRSLPEGITKLRAMDYHQPYLYYYKPTIDEALKVGDNHKALEIMNMVMSHLPVEVEALVPGVTGLNGYQLTYARIYASFYHQLAELYKLNGNNELSTQATNRYMELATLAGEDENALTSENMLKRAEKETDSLNRKQLILTAVQLAKSELVINEKDVKALFNLSEAYKSLGLYDSSLLTLQHIANAEPDNYNAWLQMGVVHGRFKNNPSVAKDYFEKARALQPESPEAYTNLGIVYIMLNENDKAITMMRKAAELKPDDKNNLNNLYMLLKNTGRMEEAAAVEQQLRVHQPK